MCPFGNYLGSTSFGPSCKIPPPAFIPWEGLGTDEKLDRSLPVFSGCSGIWTEFSQVTQRAGVQYPRGEAICFTGALVTQRQGRMCGTRRATACSLGDPVESRHFTLPQQRQGQRPGQTERGLYRAPHLAHPSEFPSTDMRKQ